MVVKAMMPKLRFRDDDGREFPGWRDSKLLDIAPLQRGFDLPVSNIKKGKFPVVFSNGILKHHDEFKVCGPGVVTGRSGTIGKVTFVEHDFWPHNTSLWVTDFKNNSPKFIYYFYCHLDLSKFGTGSGVPTLNRNDVHREHAYVPQSQEEQTKIANFLTAVDDKISQLTKKHELLTLYKKGVMQKIFNQELRFKDDYGQEFTEWELTTIGEISSKITAGGTPSTLKKEYWGGSIRWMNSGELNLKLVVEVENRITQAGLENSSTKLIPKNCVLIGLAGQGKTRGTVAMNLVELCTNQSIAAILPNPTIFNAQYLYQNLEARYDELRSLSAGDGGRGGLNLQIIKSMEINLPCLKEQAKIANFLTAIDDKITNVKSQLEASKEYKQGLLQQMFV